MGLALVSALLPGAFVTFGVLLSAGVQTEGVTLLIQGLAFAVAYYFVSLSGVALEQCLKPVDECGGVVPSRSS